MMEKFSKIDQVEIAEMCIKRYVKLFSSVKMTCLEKKLSRFLILSFNLILVYEIAYMNFNVYIL